jgi:hypothetical protein
MTERFLGPIDPRNGFPTLHKMFVVTAKSFIEAKEKFNNKFPNNVEIVYQIDFENTDLIVKEVK